MFHDDQGVIAHESLYSCFWSGVDYSKVFQEYAKCYVQILARETGIAMDYEELVSPLWYNFETDRIFAKITRQDLARMLKAVRGLRLKQLACETFTSRPGFASNYSSDIRHWGRIATWDHNQIGTVLAAYIDKLNMDGSLADEVGLAEEHITDESIETWLIEAASPAAQRALKVSDYLRRRSERAHRSAPVQPAQA